MNLPIRGEAVPPFYCFALLRDFEMTAINQKPPSLGVTWSGHLSAPAAENQQDHNIDQLTALFALTVITRCATARRDNCSSVPRTICPGKLHSVFPGAVC